MYLPLASTFHKESGKFTEGVIWSKSTEMLFRGVPRSLYLAMAMTEPEEKADRFRLMNDLGINDTGRHNGYGESL